MADNSEFDLGASTFGKQLKPPSYEELLSDWLRRRGAQAKYESPAPLLPYTPPTPEGVPLRMPIFDPTVGPIVQPRIGETERPVAPQGFEVLDYFRREGNQPSRYDIDQELRRRGKSSEPQDRTPQDELKDAMKRHPQLFEDVGPLSYYDRLMAASRLFA